MDWKKITKTQFDDAYNTHLPNGWIRFAYKYFSKSTELENIKPSKVIVGILLTFFGLGMLGTIVKWSREIIGIITITYIIILSILVLYLLSALLMNNARLRKIMKILGVTKQEYNLLVNKFYGSI